MSLDKYHDTELHRGPTLHGRKELVNVRFVHQYEAHASASAAVNPLKGPSTTLVIGKIINVKKA